MRAMTTKDNITAARYANLTDLSIYLSLGRQSADQLAREAGAKKKIGKRAIYDLQRIDEYLKAR